MKRKVRKPPKPTAADFLKEGNTSYHAGRFFLAAKAFEKARKLEPRNAAILFNLAIAKDRIGEVDEAAALLTQAARYRPSWPEAPVRLAQMLARYKLSGTKDLDPHGLLAAFAFDTLDQSPLAAVSFDHLQEMTTLGEKLATAWSGDADDVARDMVLRRTDRVLTDRLFLTALAAAPNCNIALETLLTAIRKIVLLEMPLERFEDKALTGFVLALIRQCMANDYVFAVSEAEWTKLDALSVNCEALLSGDMEQARFFMLKLLYQSPRCILDLAPKAGDLRTIRPRGLGELLAEWFEERANLTVLEANLPAIGTIRDHDEAAVPAYGGTEPYPRWRSFQMPGENSAARLLAQFFPPEKLEFLEHPFKVLIAGTGTGRKAIAAAVRYGPNADVLAIDLDRASLAYAQARAEHFGLNNIRFAQADLLRISESDEGPFNIIEASGSLCHMADPFAGWQKLAAALHPGGLMLTGLLSPVSHGNMTALRSSPDFPGTDCDANTARQYRATLIERRDDAATQLSNIHDFYTLNTFRDLVLHENERPVFLSEIEAFLEQNQLIFRGFQLPQPIISHFLKNNKKEKWPGSFAGWTRYEKEHPGCFDMMYNVWCEKAE